MINNVGLKLKQLFSRKSPAPERTSISFSQAKNIGVLINSSDVDQAPVINDFILWLESQGKKVKVICNAENMNQMFKFRYLRLDKKKALNWKGDFIEEDINIFIKSDFDYLYSINISPFLPFEIILSRSQAKCRVGCYSETKTDLFEMMVALNQREGVVELVKKMKAFTEKIKNNE